MYMFIDVFDRLTSVGWNTSVVFDWKQTFWVIEIWWKHLHYLYTSIYIYIYYYLLLNLCHSFVTACLLGTWSVQLLLCGKTGVCPGASPCPWPFHPSAPRGGWAGPNTAQNWHVITKGSRSLIFNWSRWRRAMLRLVAFEMTSFSKWMASWWSSHFTHFFQPWNLFAIRVTLPLSSATPVHNSLAERSSVPSAHSNL